jgi:hypothetical protein
VTPFSAEGVRISGHAAVLLTPGEAVHG